MKRRGRPLLLTLSLCVAARTERSLITAPRETVSIVCSTAAVVVWKPPPYSMYLYIAGRVFSFRGETLKRPSYKGHVCRVSTILIYYLFVFKICLVTVYVCAVCTQVCAYHAFSFLYSHVKIFIITQNDTFTALK